MNDLLDDGFVQEQMAYWNIPGTALAICLDDQLIFEKGYGVRNLKTGAPMTPETLGCIASGSKSFTSGVLALLADEGRLDFDRPVREYIPDFAMMDPFASQEVTVRDMLYHRTGLADHDATWPAPGVSREEYMHRLKFLAPDRPFRSTAEYNNVMYGILGHIAERISGQTWEELVRGRILDPLGMKRTCLTVGQMRADSDFAVGYFERDRGGVLEEMPPWEMGVAAPAAAVNSCAKEMINWLRLHINGGLFEGRRLFSEAVMEELHRGAVDMRLLPWHWDEVPAYGRYAMGWKVTFYRGMEVTFHTGEIEGYCAMEAFIREKKLGFMLMVNRHKPCSPYMFTLAYTIIDRALGLPAVDWPARLRAFDGKFGGTHYHWKVDLMPGTPVPGTFPTHPREQYTGLFQNEGYGQLQVAAEEGGDSLTLVYKGWRLPMEHFHYDTFRVRDIKEDTLFVTAPLTYHYDEITGEIDGLYLRLEPKVPSLWFKKVCR